MATDNPFLCLEEDPETKSILRMFYASKEMKEDYMRYRDLVIINRKFVKTKLKAAITMFYGVDSYGTSVPFGFSFMTKNEDEDKEWIVEQFLECHLMK